MIFLRFVRDWHMDPEEQKFGRGNLSLIIGTSFSLPLSHDSYFGWCRYGNCQICWYFGLYFHLEGKDNNMPRFRRICWYRTFTYILSLWMRIFSFFYWNIGYSIYSLHTAFPNINSYLLLWYFLISHLVYLSSLLVCWHVL